VTRLLSPVWLGVTTQWMSSGSTITRGWGSWCKVDDAGMIGCSAAMYREEMRLGRSIGRVAVLGVGGALFA